MGPAQGPGFWALESLVDPAAPSPGLAPCPQLKQVLSDGLTAFCPDPGYGNAGPLSFPSHAAGVWLPGARAVFPTSNGQRNPLL